MSNNALQIVIQIEFETMFGRQPVSNAAVKCFEDLYDTISFMHLFFSQKVRQINFYVGFIYAKNGKGVNC
jgi:hypothetical protein